jgi:hypothetical protein
MDGLDWKSQKTKDPLNIEVCEALLAALREIPEARKGTPKENDGLYYIDIRDYANEHYIKGDLGKFHWVMNAQFGDLFRTGAFFANKDMTKFSL